MKKQEEAAGGAPKGTEEPAGETKSRRSLRRRAGNRVVTYADLLSSIESSTDDDERQNLEAMKDQMDKIMEGIDVRPDSFDDVISFGSPPLAKLGEVGRELLTVQGKFNKQVNVIGGSWDKLEGGMKNLNMDSFGDKAKEALQGMASATGKGAKGIGKMFSGIADMFTGAKAKRTEGEKVIAEMQEALPELVAEMGKLVQVVVDTRDGIEQVKVEAVKLGEARVEATREINLYLGCQDEILRRYDEVYIPEAQAEYEASKDPEDETYMENVLKRKEDFIQQCTMLEGSRGQSIMAAQQMKMIIETLETQIKKIAYLEYNSKPEWEALLSAAGIAGSSLKSAQNIEKADAFGDKMHDQTMDMIEKSHNLTENAIGRGTVDPKKLIEGFDKIGKMIEQSAQNKKDQLKQLEQTAQALRGASDNLLEAGDRAKKIRMIEGTEEAKKNADKGKKKAAAEQAPANDDTQDAATATPAAKPRRRSDGPGPA